MNSMTGFGYAESEKNGVTLSAELKSLNSRYLDITISLPPHLSILEGRVREYLQKKFIRGRLEVIIRIREKKEPLSISLDEAVVREWKEALEKLSTLLGSNQQVPLEIFTNQSGVFKIEKKCDPEIYWRQLETLLTKTQEQVLSDRKREGLKLASYIKEQWNIISEALNFIAERGTQIQDEIEKMLRKRFQDILGNLFEEARLLSETASWLAKTDINEEIFRLRTHLDVFTEESALAGAIGKKLDFLAQEMGREVNTIGSKTPRVDVSLRVVDMKDALEKIREQLRNVE